MLLGLDHVALAVSDIPRAVRFYCDVLGLRPTDARSPDTARFFWVGSGANLSLNLALDPENTPHARGVPLDLGRSPHVAFTAPLDALPEMRARLEAAGAHVHATDTGLYFTDPDGNFLEVTAWREAALREGGAQHW